MALLDEILAETAEWPSWQSDALRRLFAQGRLQPQDLVDIRRMAEQAADAPTPVPLDASHIPQLGDGGTTTLLALRELQNVNRFANGRAIAFAATGLSIVFGENGTGKSGFSRVLKRACRARHATPVLSDAFAQEAGQPSAQIDVVDDRGNATTHQWEEGAASTAQLAMVSVYDTRCGEDYVSEDGPCDYQPYGLPYLGMLGRAQSEIQAAVGRERDVIRLDARPFDPLKGDHEVGRLVSLLSADTDLSALRPLATLTDEEGQRIAEIERIQASLDVETPAKAAAALASRLEGAAKQCKPVEAMTSDRAIDHLHVLTGEVEVAAEADLTAQALLRGEDEELLHGTGGTAWKQLFVAAQAYSQVSYPQAHEHPATDENAKCVLCQQELLPDAKTRLTRFRAYVASQAATTLANATATLADAIGKVDQTNLDVIDETLVSELRDLGADAHVKIEPAMTAWRARQQWVADAAATGNWCCPRPAPAPEPNLSQVLLDKAEIFRTKAAELRASKQEEQIKALTKEHTALIARRTLATQMSQIERYVEDAKAHRHLSKVYGALRTQGISTLITRLSERHITEALAQAMRDELDQLGYVRNAQPVVTSQTRRGENVMTLSLERTSRGLLEILSEGELRAMGLALFLAEANMRGDRSTIVFDDPSTSLDHRFRQKIANRIVELAAQRPVIVFTHDAVFLTQLQMAASDSDISPNLQSVQWDGGSPGAVISGLAWETKDFKKQFKDVREDASVLAAKANPHLNDQEKRAVRELYSRLRGTIERGVREVVLNDVVHPFVDEIKVARVGGIVGFTIEEWEAIVNLHDQCSGITSAHDTNPDRQQELPHPTDLVASLDAIAPIFEACLSRKAAFTKNHYNPHMEKRSKPRQA